MKTARFLVFLLMVAQAFCLLGPVTQAAAPKTLCRVGYSMHTMSDVDPKDAEAALRVWVNELAAQYDFHVDIKMYKDVEELVKDFHRRKLDFIVLNSVDYLRQSGALKAGPDVTQIRNGKATVKYVVLVGDRAAQGAIEGMKQKKLAVARGHSLGRIFLDVWLMRNKLQPAERFFSDIQEKSKDAQAILDTFFGRSDACLVTEAAYKMMVELNPQVGKKLRVVAESPELVASVGVFHPDYPQELRQRAIKGMSSDYMQHERGKQIILLFNVERMERISDHQFASVQRLIADHERLKPTP